MTTDPEGLAKKVMNEAVCELMAAGCHPSQIIPAMLLEIEDLRQMMRDVDAIK